MGRRPSVALCGAGMIASVHASVAASLGLPLTAVASRTQTKAKALADRFDAEVVAVDSLPGGADLVVVQTPPASHAASVLRSLEGGAAVIVETPLCTTLAQSDLLVAAATDHPGRLFYAENLAYAPVVRAFMNRVREMGSVAHLEMRAVSPMPHWRAQNRAEWGGGALFDIGAHLVALALLVAAPAAPIVVRALVEAADDPHASGDEHAELHLSFSNGLTVHLVASYRCAGIPQWDLQAAGPDQVVRAELLPTPILEVNGSEVALAAATTTPPALGLYGYRAEWEAFLQSLSNGVEPPTGPRFGRAVLDVICAAYSAARTGTTESLPFRGPRDLTPHELWRGPASTETP